MIKMKLNSKIVQIPQAMSIFINQIVYNKKSRNEYVYTYSLGEAYFDVPQIDISVEEFKRGMHYSSSYGQLALRKKIAELYERHYVAKVDPETEILISAGSKIIIYMLMLTVLSEGDEVLIPEPAWLSYREQLKMASALPVPVPYYIPIDAWVQYITPAARMIIINNPNNPSGQLYGEDDLKKILAIAEKYDLYVMSDEAYSDFLIDSTSFVSIARIDARKKKSIGGEFAV